MQTAHRKFECYKWESVGTDSLFEAVSHVKGLQCFSTFTLAYFPALKVSACVTVQWNFKGLHKKMSETSVTLEDRITG